MNELKIFKNSDFGEIRTVTINGEPHFVGKDVAEILEYQNGSRDINRHVDPEDRIKTMVFDGNQDKETILINESGLYSLILSSKMPKAKKFKRWVTSEVLPEIRKTGSYTKAPKSFKEALYLAYKQQEKIEELEKTKAWIGNKREATAMNTASQKSKEVKKLQVALDLEMSYATVKKVEKMTGRKYNWRNLKKYCQDAGLGWNKAFDSNYGSVNSYPIEAWKNVYGIEL
jgi:prophage antirepressor-like protein